MSRTLHPVPEARPARGLPTHLAPVGDPPPPGPLDGFAQARLRRLLVGHLGAFPTLDAHVALLDRRGAWYAERALGAWDTSKPDSFFGLVRHVVRTQLPGPAPQPDVEGWLAAGRPSDAFLATTWDTLNAHRYPTARRVPATARTVSSPVTDELDAILTAWPADHLDRFAFAYAALENVLERRHVILPPIDA